MISQVPIWHVYIVRCSDGSFYTGITNNLKRRIKQHNGEQPGGARYTRAKGPVELVYKEKYKDRSDSAKREYYIKNVLSRQQKQVLIRDTSKNNKKSRRMSLQLLPSKISEQNSKVSPPPEQK